MKAFVETTTLNRIKSGAVAVFIFQDEAILKKQVSGLPTSFRKKIETVIALKNFSGKSGEVVRFFTYREIASPRLLVVGLGESKSLSLEVFRRAAAAAAKAAKSLKASSLAIEFPLDEVVLRFPPEDIAQSITEGAVLALYKFDKYLAKDENNVRMNRFTLFTYDRSLRDYLERGVRWGDSICASVYHARDLANAPGSEIYPETLARDAQVMGRKHGFKVTILDRKRIEKLGMGGVIGVSRGSAKPPRFIILEYRPRRKRGRTVVLVGKGVTFDTGGISIKPAANMSEMKMDMSGAAAVIGTFLAASQLQLPVHLIGLIPSAENMPSGTAVKPGDIIRHYNGTTSEVDNTDAEGRLILADALAYAARYKPSLIIDLATLTGACVVALGHHATGMMGNDDGMMEKLRAAGEKSYERVWQLPLFDEYEKLIKSDVADVKNVGGRWAGTITAAWFLKKFVKNFPWIHLDIAGTAILEEAQEYAPKGGSGVGVRLLVEFLRNWKGK